MVPFLRYSLMQKNRYTFATVYNSKCVSVFLHQTIHDEDICGSVRAVTCVTFITRVDYVNLKK